MRVSEEYKHEARRKMVDAAGRGFRKNGYGGLGVDGLAKEAGVTSGAFYGHFKSKDEAFKAAMIQGLVDYRDGVIAIQAEKGSQWLKAFLDYYLGEKHCANIEGSCAVPSLSADVMRASVDTKSAYATLLDEIANAIAAGLPNKSRESALALMALLSGAVTMARSAGNKKSSSAILKSARKVAETLV